LHLHLSRAGCSYIQSCHDNGFSKEPRIIFFINDGIHGMTFSETLKNYGVAPFAIILTFGEKKSMKSSSVVDLFCSKPHNFFIKK